MRPSPLLPYAMPPILPFSLLQTSSFKDKSDFARGALYTDIILNSFFNNKININKFKICDFLHYMHQILAFQIKLLNY